VLPLVAGSLAPDLTYFLPERVTRALPNCHQLPGAITVAPIAAFLSLAAACLLNGPLTSLLWGRHRSAVSSALGAFGRTRADWLAAIPAVALGITLHLVWDAFTHPHGWPVQHWPLLRVSLVTSRDGFQLFRILQWVSSVAGIAAIAVWYRHAAISSIPTTTPPAIPFSRRVALKIIAVTAGVSGLIRGLVPSVGFESLHGRMYLATTTGLSMFVCLYALVGLAAANHERRARASSAW
jgi:hypothetical protein